MWVSRLRPEPLWVFTGHWLIHSKAGSEIVSTRVLTLRDKSSGVCSVHLTDTRGGFLCWEQGLWIILWGKNCVISSNATGTYSKHYEIHYTESRMTDFYSPSLLQPRTTAYSSTLSHPICLIISRDTCTEDGNFLFHLLFQTNAPSSPAYTSNFLQHPGGKIFVCWDW